MSAVKIIGIVLLVVGVVVLVLGAYDLIMFNSSTGGKLANKAPRGHASASPLHNAKRTLADTSNKR